MRLVKIDLLILVLLLFVSCGNEKEIYKYENGISQYLNEEFNVKNKNGFFYFLHLSDCYTCCGTGDNLRMLTEVSKQYTLTVVIIGKTNRQDFVDKIKNLKKENIICIEDSLNSIQYYETGVLKPLLMHYDKNENVFFKRIIDSDIPFVKEYICNHQEKQKLKN